MKDKSKQAFETTRPDWDSKAAIQYCLTKMYKNQKKKTGDKIVKGLTYEDIIGALLLGRDAVEELERLKAINLAKIP